MYRQRKTARIAILGKLIILDYLVKITSVLPVVKVGLKLAGRISGNGANRNRAVHSISRPEYDQGWIQAQSPVNFIV